jgi:hypothetical protein
VTYALRVKFKSNEAPWSGGYEPASRHQAADDKAAIDWAASMASGMGSDYLVTLIRDGVVIPLPAPAEDCGSLLRGMGHLPRLWLNEPASTAPYKGAADLWHSPSKLT